MERRGGIDVLDPGLLTTVQDLGRPGQMRHGVSPGGALDRSALILGNRLCGNEPGAAGLEITLTGPRLRFTAPAVIALTGADLGGALDGGALPRWQPVAVPAEAEIAFLPTRTGHGSRAYLCVAGGVVVPPVLGSRATDLAAGLGGVDGRALRPGDRLAFGRPSGPAAALLGRRLTVPAPEYPSDVTIRVVMGPQRERFTKKGVAAFLDGPYTVSPKGDRMGVRLIDGPPIAHRRGADLISEGIVPGSIQVPGDGQPIALLAACQTMGGYPKIATVIGADLDRLAQVRPGDRIRFTAIDPPAGRAATLAYRAALGEHAVATVARPPERPSAPSVTLESVAPSVAATTTVGPLAIDAWTPDGVVRVIAALHAAGLMSFRLDLAEGDRRLTLDLGESATASADRASLISKDPAPTTRATEDTIAAPMLGVFYRQPKPGEPPFVTPGDPVTAGQTIGLLEVMKTFYEVTAHRAGTVIEFLIADGDFVEYGQPIARIG